MQLDSLEFFLSTIPESLLDEIGPISLVLLQCSQYRREDLSKKALEILQFIKEILTAELVLPHFIAALDTHSDQIDWGLVELALVYLHQLVDEIATLEEQEHLNAIISSVMVKLEQYMASGRRP